MAGLSEHPFCFISSHPIYLHSDGLQRLLRISPSIPNTASPTTFSSHPNVTEPVSQPPVLLRSNPGVREGRRVQIRSWCILDALFDFVASIHIPSHSFFRRFSLLASRFALFTNVRRADMQTGGRNMQENQQREEKNSERLELKRSGTFSDPRKYFGGMTTMFFFLYCLFLYLTLPYQPKVCTSSRR